MISEIGKMSKIPFHISHKFLLSQESSLEIALRKQLAIDYTKHILWMGGEYTNEQSLAYFLLNTTTLFVQKEITIEEAKKRKTIYHQKSFELDVDPETPKTIADEIEDIIFFTFDLCCLDELKEAKLVSLKFLGNRQPPSLTIIAELSAFVAARFAAGVGWKDFSEESDTFLRGYKAFENEVRWQLDQIERLKSVL